MNSEREKLFYPARMPEDVFDQLLNLPSDSEQKRICKRLFIDVAKILMENDIAYDPEKSLYRVKSREDIRKKSITRKSTSPVRDIYGVRFIVKEEDRFSMSQIFYPEFPLTPEKFEGGRPSIREYADPETRNYMRNNFNPHIGEYSALHVNVVFQRLDAKVLDIAEIQIMTKNELEASKDSRSLYTSRRQNGHSTL